MRRLILLLLAAVIVFGGIGVMGAYFTAQTEVPDNLIRGGAVSVSTEPTASPLSIDGLAPGTTAVKTLTVVNDGNLSENVVVTGAKKAGITDFYNALTAHVIYNGDVLYDGPMASLRTAPFALAAGARAQLQFGIGLPADAGNDLAGDYAKMTLYVDGEQTH